MPRNNAERRPMDVAPHALLEDNRLQAKDRAVHDWYRFVLSFPAHLVRHYIKRFHVEGTKCVLDPFCGTGTTLVECKKQGINSVGIEANPMAWFASRVKVNWDVPPKSLVEHARRIARLTDERLHQEGLTDVGDLPLFQNAHGSPQNLKALPPEAAKLVLKDSISPLPLHKVLVLLDTLASESDDRFDAYERLALAKETVCALSNLRFGPEVGVGRGKQDAPVVSSWLHSVATMADDLRQLCVSRAANATVHLGDARQAGAILEAESIDAVITSPPYPNEKDYTRTTRLESVLLGFIRDKEDLRKIKRSLVRSNTRGVYQGDDDDTLVSEHDEIQGIAQEIEKRRVDLGKTSGFERLYAKVTKLYFGGMKRHLAGLRTALRRNAQLAYVVGDQESYLRVLIPTGKILADIAQSLGYEVLGLDLFRTRLATATQRQLREEVVLLRWPGH